MLISANCQCSGDGYSQKVREIAALSSTLLRSAHHDGFLLSFCYFSTSIMNYSSDNHNTQSSIFINTKDMMKQHLKQLNRRAKTARIIFFVVVAMLLLSSLLFLKDDNFEILKEDWTLAVLPGSGILFLVLALLSVRQPFIFLLILTIIWCIGLLINLYQTLFLSSSEMTAIGRIAVQLVITLYLIRGVIAADKARQLQEAITQQS